MKKSKYNKVDNTISVLKNAIRIGPDKDVPEGVRYIRISDTLANKLIKELEVNI